MRESQEEWARWKYYVMARSQKEYLALRQLFSGNQYPLTAEGVKAAHELSATHHAKGKIVLVNE